AGHRPPPLSPLLILILILISILIVPSASTLNRPSMILCLGTTPAAQRVMLFRKLTLDAVNRAVTTLDGAAGKSVNVAKVLKTLGQQPLATGFLGGPRGRQVRALLIARGIKVDFVIVDAPTRQC